jgi:hypothetical protein
MQLSQAVRWLAINIAMDPGNYDVNNTIYIDVCGCILILSHTIVGGTLTWYCLCYIPQHFTSIVDLIKKDKNGALSNNESANEQ